MFIWSRRRRARSESLSALLRTARELMEQRRFDEALGVFDEAAKRTRNTFHVYLGMAWTLLEMGRYEGSILAADQAIGAFNRPVMSYGDQALAWSAKGIAYLRMKQYDEAINALESAIARCHDLAYCWTWKGAALAGLKRYDEALAAIDHAATLDPNDMEVWLTKTQVMWGMKRHRSALGAADRALEQIAEGTATPPTTWTARAWGNEGYCLALLGRIEEALSCYEKALAIKPGYAHAWANKAETLCEVGRYEEGLDAAQHAVDLNADVAHASRALGTALTGLGRYDDALAAFNLAADASLDPADLWVGSEMAKLLLKLDQPEKALATAERALALDAELVDAWRAKGDALRALGRADEASAAANHADTLEQRQREA